MASTVGEQEIDVTDGLLSRGQHQLREIGVLDDEYYKDQAVRLQEIVDEYTPSIGQAAHFGSELFPGTGLKEMFFGGVEPPSYEQSATDFYSGELTPSMIENLLQGRGIEAGWQALSGVGDLAYMAPLGIGVLAGPAIKSYANAQKMAGRLSRSTPDRLARAQDQGFDTDEVWYHGSTHDIESMGGDTVNPESHFGSGYYLTSSSDDASKHYAKVGPDLTNRIHYRADEIATGSPSDALEKNGDINYQDALKAARAELKGDTEGVIYPAYTRTQKTFDISSDGDTFLEYKQPELDPKDYLDEADGDMDLAEELATEDSYDFEPEGDLVDFIDALKWDDRINDEGKQKLISAILDESYDGGISAKRLDEIMRETEYYAEDIDTGGIRNSEVYRDALEKAGFDSVIHDGNIFRGMEVEPGTKHKIIFDPKNIRSINAEFDPEKIDSSDLLAYEATGRLSAV